MYNLGRPERLKGLACEVFKSLNQLNPNFMANMFTIKETGHNLRNQVPLIQPDFKKVRYGKNTFQYYANHIWNILPNSYKICSTLKEFKNMLKIWDGPKCQCNMCDSF